MPNHITNKIIFYGTKSNIEKVFELIKGEGKVIDFNTLVPMPESIENTESGILNDYDIMYYLTEKCTIPYQDCDLKFLNKVIKNMFYDNWLGEVWNRISKQIAEGNPPNYDQGKQLVDNYVKYGAINWDEWSCKYWGTKWNAYYQYINDNVIYFDTAWSCPFPILNALAELCRKYNVRFEGKWADEDMGNNTGTFSSNSCDNCEYGCDFYLAEDCSSEAYAIYAECKGESNCLDKEAQGN